MCGGGWLGLGADCEAAGAASKAARHAPMILPLFIGERGDLVSAGRQVY
jgi:hypothetical protein